MLRNFVLKTIDGMIGNELDYKVREYTLGWVMKGVLTEEDMLAIDAKIEAQYVTAEEEVTEETEVEAE